jgi:hypothetical protein
VTSKALAYAEVNLGVHTVYENAVAKRNELDSILTNLSEARDNRRDIELKITDREMEITIDQRSKHPDMPVTRWDKHIKESFRDDDEMRALREQNFKVVGDIEGLEFDKQICETDIKIAVSRMTELGGYLSYLAAVKLAQPVKPETPVKPQTGASE